MTTPINLDYQTDELKDKPVLEIKQVKLGEYFRRFADAVENPEYQKRMEKYDPESKEFIELVGNLKKYAFEKMDFNLNDNCSF